MRIKKETVSIRIDKSIKDRIDKDREHFQKVIGGPVWAVNDVLKEWIKILDSLKED